MVEKVNTKQMKPVGSSLSMVLDGATYVLTLQLKDQNGNNLGAAQSVDLPLETMVVSGAYDEDTKKIILTLQNGQTIEFSVADLVSGLQTEITVNNKLSASLIDGLLLSILGDIALSSPQDGQVLMYDAATQKWKNVSSTASIGFDAITGSPEDNAALESALQAKADTGTTLADYNISDAYTKTEVDTALSGKANAATTLAGYDISDAYTKTEVDTAIGQKISCVLRRW